MSRNSVIATTNSKISFWNCVGLTATDASKKKMTSMAQSHIVFVGDTVGWAVGVLIDGNMVGVTLGADDDGEAVGWLAVGVSVGLVVGSTVGYLVGEFVGLE